MMNTPGQQNQGAAPSLCTNACGFYGNPTTRNLCSKCYRDLIREETRKHANQPASVLSFLEETSHSLAKEKENLNGNKITASTVSVVASSPDISYSGSTQKEPDSETAQSIENCSLPFQNVCENVTHDVEKLNLTSTSPTLVPSSTLKDTPSIDPISRRLVASNSCSQNAKTDGNGTVSSKPIQVNTQRCFKCSKKVGLLGFRCRCEYVFCGAHRHADGHQCMFDYKTYEREQLSKANQKVVASKINRL